MKQLIVTLFMLGSWAAGLQAQEPSLQIACAPDSVRLGTPFQCNCQLALPANASLQALQLSFDSLEVLQAFVPGSDTIPTDYEIVSFGNWSAGSKQKLSVDQMHWQPTKQGGMSIYQNTISVLIWQPGVFKLPPLVADVIWNGQGYAVQSNELGLLVTPPGQDQVSAVDSSGMAPIKPIIETAPVNIWKWVAIIGLSFLAFMALVVFVFVKIFKKKVVPVEFAPISAHEKAYRALAKIKKKGEWNKGELKSYYDELTHVLRSYLEDRYEIPALESTTDEILRDLHKTELPNNFIQGMQRLLPMTDMVKFAKVQPHEEEHATWLSWVKELVDTTKKVIVPIEENDLKGE